MICTTLCLLLGILINPRLECKTRKCTLCVLLISVLSDRCPMYVATVKSRASSHGRSQLKHPPKLGVGPYTENLLEITSWQPPTSNFHGFHIYKSLWTPGIGEELSTVREASDTHDLFAVAIWSVN